MIQLGRRKFWGHHRPPSGRVLTKDAAVIDSGNWADQVYAFCRTRSARRILSGKGMPGFARPSLTFSTSRKVRLGLVGLAGIKMALHQRLAHGETILFSDQLGGDYFDQLVAERLVVRYTRGQPVKKWELTSGRRNEALDTLTYSYAARGLVGLDLNRRADDLASVSGPQTRTTVARSKWLDG